MAGDEALIALRDVSKTFDDGSVHALRGVDLSVSAGEFVAVTGPSGSGKSSLVHIMAGFDAPSGGSVSWKGRPMRDQRGWTALRRSGIGIVFQEFLLLATLSARENVELAMSGSGLGGAAQRRRAGELLEQVGLAARMDNQPFALSGGERQRVAIARGIANRPELLLCDEPTGNLDSANAAAVMELLLGLRRETGMAMVLVTHDPQLAALGERQVRMRDGRVEQAGNGGGT